MSPTTLLATAALLVATAPTGNPPAVGAVAPGSHASSTGGVVAAATNDPIDGVAMIYPTKPGGQTWHLGNDPSADPRLDGSKLRPNGDGTFAVRDPKTRLGVATTTYDRDRDEDRLVWDQARLRTRGYMHDPRDWRNVEITGYVQYNAGRDDGDAFTWYARGARHTGSGGAPQACWGTAYKGNLRFSDGAVRFEKEVYHDGGAGYASDEYRRSGASLRGRMTGFKVAMYSIPGGVRLEAYLDRDNTNEWTKAWTRDDTGAWLIGSRSPCGGSASEVLTWGGPTAAFRWDDATDVDVAQLSVREITPPGDREPPQPQPCGSGLPSTGATATTSENANPAAHAVDGKLATRWSGRGSGAALTLDLGAATSVCGAKVAWYRGDVRWNDYAVATSAAGIRFAKAWEGRSSGRTTSAETVTFAPRVARYLRVSFRRNSENNWASVTEAQVLAPSR